MSFLTLSQGILASSGGAMPIAPIDPSTLSNWAIAFDALVAGSITESSGLVSQLNDLSGNNRNVTAIGAARPTYSAAGGGVITFNGTANVMQNTQPYMCAAGSWTGFIVASLPTPSVAGAAPLGEGRLSTGNPLYQPIRGWPTASNQNAYGFIRNDASGNILLNTASLGAAPFNATKNIITIVDTGSNLSMRVNGVDGSAPQNYTRSGTFTLDRYAIGALVRNTTSGFCAMDFYAHHGFTGVKSIEEIRGVEVYLSERYGVLLA